MPRRSPSSTPFAPSTGLWFGYARVSKADGSQSLDLQVDALRAAGIDQTRIFTDRMSGAKEARPGLAACFRTMRPGDTLVVWKLDRLGRSLRQLIDIISQLDASGVAFKVLTGQGAAIDTTRPEGRFVFAVFAALTEFERELIRERTRAGLQSARTRGKVGGRRPKMTPAKVRTAASALADAKTNVAELSRVLGVHRSTIYRCVNADGSLTEHGRKLLENR